VPTGTFLYEFLAKVNFPSTCEDSVIQELATALLPVDGQEPPNSEVYLAALAFRILSRLFISQDPFSGAIFTALR
jgi:hypothetical protein